MKNFFTTTIFLLLTALIFQACESSECQEDIVSDEQKITTDLAEKIIATATSVNDLNFILNNYTSGNCYLQFGYHFVNPEGDSFISASVAGASTSNFYDIVSEDKKLAKEFTGTDFTDDDFFIDHIIISYTISNSFMANTDDGFLDIFDNCTVDNTETAWNSMPLSEVNFNCKASASYIINDVGSWFDFVIEDLPLSGGLTMVENELNAYNTTNSTSYTLDDLRLSSLNLETTLNIYAGNIYGRKNIKKYFDNCSFSRDSSDNDCLNFVYPLKINRFNLQLEEVITNTIESDEDLIDTLSIDSGELGFVFPIALLGQDGSTIEINNNEALGNALDNAATYCD